MQLTIKDAPNQIFVLYFCAMATILSPHRKIKRGVNRLMLLTAINLLTGLVMVNFAYAVNCGDVLGPGGFYTLKKDINCDTEITVVGPATFDLKGHTITSSPLIWPLIRVEGKHAKIRNGRLKDCAVCILVGGDGAHKIRHMEVQVGSSDGIIVESNHNRIIGNRVTTADFAFSVRGHGNLLLRNTANNNHGDGFVISGVNQQLIRNRAKDNINHGISVSGSHHKLIGNKVTGSFLPSRAIDIWGDHHLLIGNISIGNTGNGFFVAGEGHLLMGNKSKTNGDSGIMINAVDSKMIQNRAFDNGDGVSTFDLYDSHQDCDNNSWINNLFGTRNQDCIR